MDIIHVSSFGLQYLPSTDVHINENAKFDPSSKIYEVIGHHLIDPYLNISLCVSLPFCFNIYASAILPWQISKRWKLQSIEQQQQELEAKKKAKQEAKEQAKKASGNGVSIHLL